MADLPVELTVTVSAASPSVAVSVAESIVELLGGLVADGSRSADGKVEGNASSASYRLASK